MKYPWRVAFAAGAAIALALLWWTKHRTARLPYHDGFAQNRVSEWVPYGGVWNLEHGAVINRSEEGGAKLATGSPDWSDYQVTADLQLRESDGDVGIVARAGHLREGIDALHGYYALLRSDNESLVLGAANDDHLERLPSRLAGGLQRRAWYRLHMVVVGCDVAAEALDLTTGKSTYSALRDNSDHCFKSGQIALRSNYGGGAWRNVHVEKATLADLRTLEERSGAPLTARYPIREDEYARMWEANTVHPGSPDPEVPLWVHENERLRGEPNVITAATLHSLTLPTSAVRLRGTITSTNPLYVQDATGGIRIIHSEEDGFNVGDEIEAIGRPQMSGNEQVVNASVVRLLWERTPIAPISIAPSQASSGHLDGSLIEVSGTLLSTHQQPDGSTKLHLDNASEEFTLSLQHDVFNSLAGRWPVASTIRAYGICTPPNDPSSDGAFTLLVASASNIQLLSGPPWWSGWRLVAWIALLLAFIAAGFYFAVRGERSKMQAILKERERLSHDMHDTLAQDFAGVAFFLQGLRKALIETGATTSQVQDVSLACEMVAGAHRDASASIAALHPDAQKGGDLLDMLQRTTASMVEGGAIAITLHRDGSPRPLSPTQTDVLFRVGREAIANVLRHAQATRITLGLAFTKTAVLFSIADNGVGMNADQACWGFGLRCMEQRCSSVQAELRLKSEPGHGCTVECLAPYGKSSFTQMLLRRFRSGF